jgi:predicted HTH domain antitoxin
MSSLLLEISNDVAESLQIPPSERLPRVQRELAVRLYQKGLLSFGKARELAQMTKWEFHSLLGDEAIDRSYDLEELENDLKTLEQLN